MNLMQQMQAMQHFQAISNASLLNTCKVFLTPPKPTAAFAPAHALQLLDKPTTKEESPEPVSSVATNSDDAALAAGSSQAIVPATSSAGQVNPKLSVAAATAAIFVGFSDQAGSPCGASLQILLHVGKSFLRYLVGIQISRGYPF
jgi:hypothetical protein